MPALTVERLADELADFVARERREHPDGAGTVADLIAFQGRLHAAGLAVVTWPVEHGGRGLPLADGLLVADAIGAAELPELINFVGIDVLAPALQQVYDPELLRVLLPRMASAEEIWCQMFSEPGAGSDLAALSCRAEREAGGWRVTGQKVWSTWGVEAQRGVLLARTGTRESRHRGITAFVVDMQLPGITVRPLRTMTGEEEFAEVFFDGALLPEEALFGEVDGGWDVAQLILASERGTYAVRRGGILRGKHERLMRRVRASSTAATRTSALDATLALNALDCRVAILTAQVAAGQDPGFSAAVTKVLLTRAEQAIGRASLDALGADALTWSDGPAPELQSYLYSRAASIYGGTAQVQRNIIAERLLGMPRDNPQPSPRGGRS